MGRWVGDRLSQTRPIPRSPDGDKKIMISGALPPRRCLVLGKVGKSLKPPALMVLFSRGNRIQNMNYARKKKHNRHRKSL